MLDGTSDPALLSAATQAKASALFRQGDLEGVVALLDPLVRREDAGAATMLLASALRGTGRDGAVAWLGRAVDAAATDAVPAPAAEMPLFFHVAKRLDPGQVSPEWAEHKEAQAARMVALVREGLVAAVTGDEWAPVADDPRYREAVRRAEGLAS